MQRNAPEPDWPALRQDMVTNQLVSRGITDQRVLDAMRCIPRERFVADDYVHQAYDDGALPHEHGQTISQPFIVAYMTALLKLKPTDVVLEVGTGTGYQTAVLARLCAHVHTIERLDSLRRGAKALLAELDIANVSFHLGDGSLGLAGQAPYDGIIVTAAAPRIPDPLSRQLADGATLVCPVGGAIEQHLSLARRKGDQLVSQSDIGCRFVKLVGQYGWDY